MCSSANSVLFYMPWSYVNINLAHRLAPASELTTPLLAGLLFFGFCSVYETQARNITLCMSRRHFTEHLLLHQGPSLGWWRWPRSDGVLAEAWEANWDGFPAASAGRGLVVTQHAAEALKSRVWGVPALAVFFHSALGWGLASALQLFPLATTSSLRALGRNAVGVVLLTPALAMLWDGAFRVLKALTALDDYGAVAFLMGFSFFLSFAAGPGLSSRADSDPLLFSVSLLHHAFFLLQAVRHWSDHAMMLKSFVLLTSFAYVAFALRATRPFAAGRRGGSPATPERLGTSRKSR
jgi:hypothetical protein